MNQTVLPGTSFHFEVRPVYDLADIMVARGLLDESATDQPQSESGATMRTAFAALDYARDEHQRRLEAIYQSVADKFGLPEDAAFIPDEYVYI